MLSLVLLAVFPPLYLAKRVFSYDRIEKEPIGLLVKLFFFGVLITIPASFIEGFVLTEVIEPLNASEVVTAFLSFFLLVPITEEGLKRLVLQTTRKDPNFNYTFDGIVYAVMASLGFATAENIMYVLSTMSYVTAVARGITSIPLHCICGVFMGYYYGVSRGQEVYGAANDAKIANKLSMVVPVFIHGLFDFSLAFDSAIGLLVAIGFTAFMIFVAIQQVRVASANDQPIAPSFSAATVRMPPERKGAARDGRPPRPFNG